MTRVPYADDEYALDGGNVAAGVVRVGGTVRKPAGFWTPAVEALLSHLRCSGFTGAPRPLGRAVRVAPQHRDRFERQPVRRRNAGWTARAEVHPEGNGDQTLVSRVRDSLTKSGDLVEDLVGGFMPHK